MKLTLIVILLFALLGCSQVRTWTLEASQEDLANAVVSRQVADNFISIWSLNSGAMQCGMEDYLPPLILKKIQTIDEAVKNMSKWSVDDYNKGCFLGRRGNLIYEQVRALIDQLIPLVMKMVGK